MRSKWNNICIKHLAYPEVSCDDGDDEEKEKKEGD